MRPTEMADLICAARRLIIPGERRVLGIAGAPGSGKSTLARALAGAFGGGAVLVGMDGFHLANRELDRLGRRERKGAPDTFDARGYVNLLGRIRDHATDVGIYAPEFDRRIEESIGSAIPIPAGVPLVITEGNYLLVDDDDWHPVRPLLDECWFVDTDEGVRVRRLIARHMRYGRSERAAREWALGPDQRNADLIATTRGRADRVVRLPELPPGQAS